MPYLLLIIGSLIGVYTLYRFLLRANVKEIQTLLLSIIVAAIGIALFVLALTGRLPAAIAIVGAMWPFAVAWLRHKAQKKASATSHSTNSAMTRAEAWETLGLKEGAGEEEIKDAHKRLMKKLHPDQDGSEGLAKRLNEAKDILLKPN